MGFVRIFWKNNIQEAYLPIISILGTPKKLRRVLELSEHNWAKISEKICYKMLIFGKWASWTLFFQKILTNAIISEIWFYDVITLELYESLKI